MKIRFLTAASGSFDGRSMSIAPGEVVDLSEDECRRWIKAGYAEPAEPQKASTAKRAASTIEVRD